MKTEQATTAPTENEFGHLKNILTSRRLKVYGGIALVLTAGVVSLKLLFPPIPQEMLQSSSAPFITEQDQDHNAPKQAASQIASSETIPDELKSGEPGEGLPREAGRAQKKEVTLTDVDTKSGQPLVTSQEIPLSNSKTKKIKQAGSAVLEPLKKQPPSREVLEVSTYNRGVSFLQNSDPVSAIREFKKVLSINPLNVEAYNNLGLAFMTSGKEGESVRAFQMALIIDPGCTKCMNNLALIYLKKAEPSLAVDYLQQVLAERPEDAEAWSNLGVAYKIQGRLHDAERAYLKALSLSPEDFRTHFNMAQTLELQGKISEAIFHYEIFLRIFPSAETSRVVQVIKHLDNLKSTVSSPPARGIGKDFEVGGISAEDDKTSGLQSIEESTPVQTQGVQTEDDMNPAPPERKEMVPMNPDIKVDLVLKEPSGILQKTVSASEATAKTPTDLRKAKMAQWIDRLRNTPSTQYTIQVEICGNLDFIQDDLNLYLSEYDAMVVPFKVKSWEAYTLLVGLFDTREQGNAAIRKLPPSIRKKGPLIMTLSAIQPGLEQVQDAENFVIPKRQVMVPVDLGTQADSELHESTGTPQQAIPTSESSVKTPAYPGERRMAQWMDRLRNTPSAQYTIQVEICGNLDFIQDDLKRYLSDNDAMVVPFKVKSWKVYTLLVGFFDTRKQGNAAIHKLPSYIRRKSPLVMTVGIIQKGMGPENKFKKSSS